MLDPEDVVKEDDLDRFSEDNTATLVGAYWPSLVPGSGPDGPVYVHGTSQDDVYVVTYEGEHIVLSSSTNGNPPTLLRYPKHRMGGFRIRTHGNNDTILGNAVLAQFAVWTGQGDDRVECGSGPDAIWNSGGSDTISGGDGNDVIQGGDANDEILGGPGSDVFRYGPGDSVGQDIIHDFNKHDSTKGLDRIDLSDFQDLSFKEVLGASTQLGWDTVITLPSGKRVRLRNFRRSDLAPSDFTGLR